MLRSYLSFVILKRACFRRTHADRMSCFATYVQSLLLTLYTGQQTIDGEEVLERGAQIWRFF
jgi:hypothetical protein